MPRKPKSLPQGRKVSRASAQPQARAPRRSGVDTFRQEVMALHRQIFRRNQERINDSVLGYTASFRRYEREYLRGVGTYRRRASFAELDRQLAKSNVLYVGDYHTLPQAQRTFLRVLRRLPANRPVVVALEFVQGRHQRAVDAYMAGTLPENDFLRAIHHHSHWIFGGWPSFKQIFDLARERGHRVIGIDSAGQSIAGSSLQPRDAYAARRIVQAWRAQPNALVIVLTGELHVAPGHLPRHVQDEAQGLELAVQPLILYQNCERIYAALQQRGLEHDVPLVQVAPGAYCVLNTPPIVCQQSFLNWLYADEDGAQIEEPEQTFKEYARLIATFFDLQVGDALDAVELTTVADLSFFGRLRRRGDFSRHDMDLIRQQILASESYYIPRAKMAYLGNLSVNHVSEEATHFLRHVCADLQDPKLLVDAFYARCIEEALGFLGSKIINHRRKALDVDDFERLRTARTAAPEQKLLARLVLRHVRMETGIKVRNMAQVYSCDADMFNRVTHVLGYRLGNRLYYGLVQNHLQKAHIRALFFDTFEEEGTALATYLYWLTRTATVRLPDPF